VTVADVSKASLSWNSVDVFQRSLVSLQLRVPGTPRSASVAGKPRTGLPATWTYALTIWLSFAEVLDM